MNDTKKEFKKENFEKPVKKEEVAKQPTKDFVFFETQKSVIIKAANLKEATEKYNLNK